MQNPVNTPKRIALTDAPKTIPMIAPVDKPADDLSSVIFVTVVVVFVAFDVYCVGVSVVLSEVVILVGVVELDEVVFVGVVEVFVEVVSVVGVVVVFVVGACVKSSLEIQSVSTVMAPRA